MPESGASSAGQGNLRGEASRLPVALKNMAARLPARWVSPTEEIMRTEKFVLALATLLAAGIAMADINIGVTLSATGPAASLGIPEKNTLEMIGSPTIGGQKLNFVVLDAKPHTTQPAQNTRQLITQNTSHP